jgi:signal transduction histidine kinase
MAVHDLRTPLAIIQGYSQLLDVDLNSDDPNIREYIANILAHADSLSAMIDNLVLYDQVEQGQLRLFLAECDLKVLVEQAMAQVEGLTSIKNLTITPDFTFSPTVTVDEKHINRVLYSLLGHAAKYAQPDSELFISASASGAFGQVSLRDPNFFLNEKKRARLFDLVENSQAGASSLRGMDMGLVVGRHIAEAHGGRLEATCKLDEGTTLHLYLPLAGTMEPQSGAAS